VIGKLGKLAPVNDARDLRLATYIDREALSVPGRLPLTRCWSERVPRWGMFENDRLGCCAVTAACHAIQTWSAHAGRPFMVSIADVESAYSAISGYDGRPETDTGATLNALCKYWRTYGIGGVPILAWVSVDPRDPVELAAAMDLCGGVLCGFQLPRSIEAEGNVWISTVGDPGTLGGHAVWLPDRSMHTRNAPSWAELRRMVPEFLTRYCDEAIAPVCELWLGRDNRTPHGLRLAELLDDLRAVTESPLDAGIRSGRERPPVYRGSFAQYADDD